VSGKEISQRVKGKRQTSVSEIRSSFSFLLSPFSFFRISLPRVERGFTLLELMIVMFILVILAAIALPQYQKIMLHARESVLRDDLYQMRKAIDQYAADKGKLPQSLDDLTGQYLREVPVDPITEQKDWNVSTGEDPNSTEGGQGITDVHSSSGDQSSDGSPYSEW
jgi:general secretion pathway protein G